MATYKLHGYLVEESKNEYSTFAEAQKAFNEIIETLQISEIVIMVSRVCARIYFKYRGYSKYAGTIYIKKYA